MNLLFTCILALIVATPFVYSHVSMNGFVEARSFGVAVVIAALAATTAVLKTTQAHNFPRLKINQIDAILHLRAVYLPVNELLTPPNHAHMGYKYQVRMVALSACSPAV